MPSRALRIAGTSRKLVSLEEEIARQVALVDVAPGKDGKDGTNGRDGTSGRDGTDGRDGRDGRDGINGKDGQGLRWTGNWNVRTTYALNDLVNYLGSTYICTEENTNKPPNNHKSVWGLLAAAGAAGTNGRDGTDGADADIMNLYDAFGRLRVSEPYTLFDSKQTQDALALFWDDQEVSGSGTTSVHSVARASSTLGVAANTAGRRTRQTFQRFNYQPGKSYMILLTGILTRTGGGSGISTRIGYFDDDNGVFVSEVDGTVYMNIRSSVSGSAVDNSIAQADWNTDKLDGTGASGITLDTSKTQIFYMDLEWLGVGTVRTGFVIDGEFIVCHTFNHANSEDAVYMSTPNLPVRYEIENDGTGAASTLEHICSTVISEGGQQATGQLHHHSTGGTHINANSADTLYAIVGLRLKSTSLDQQVDLSSFSMMNATADDFEWLLIFNPTITGTFTWADHPNSSVQAGTGDATGPTASGGHVMAGGLVKSGGGGSGFVTLNLQNALRLGAAIDGTPDEIILCCRPFTSNADIDAGLSWRELR